MGRAIYKESVMHGTIELLAVIQLKLALKIVGCPKLFDTECVFVLVLNY